MRPVHWLYTIPMRLRSLFRWAQADQELDDELREHLERKTEEYVVPRRTPRKLDSGFRSGFALWSAHTAQISWLHGCCCAHACPGHRSHHGDFHTH